MSVNRHHIQTKPTRISEISFEDLYDEISDDWQGKAMRLQARRWRKLKQQLS